MNEFVKHAHRVRTRSGCRVEQLKEFKIVKEDDYPLVGVVDGTIQCWTLGGRYDPEYPGDSPWDLVIDSEEEVYYVLRSDFGRYHQTVGIHGNPVTTMDLHLAKKWTDRDSIVMRTLAHTFRYDTYKITIKIEKS